MIGYAIALDRPELLGDVEVIPQAPVSGGVTVELRAGSRWNVTAPGWITALTIEAGSLLHGRLLVDGAAAEPLAGTYRGFLQVLPPEDWDRFRLLLLTAFLHPLSAACIDWSDRKNDTQSDRRNGYD